MTHGWEKAAEELAEDVARMRKELEEIRLHVEQAGGNARLRPKFIMDCVNRGLGEREGGE
jgi:hypothetical protein